MPKEVTYGTERPVFEDGRQMSQEEWDNEQPIVQVSWRRYPESHVQLVTRLKGYEVMLGTEDKNAYKYGMYVDLDRDGINNLIRNLRRARDQAFRRDE